MVLSSRRPGRNSKLQQIPLPEILRQGSFLFQAEGLALFRAKGSIPIGRGGHARAFFPAHNGILFIDEFCEMPQKTIEVLRGRNDGGHRGTSSGGKTAAKGTLCR